MDTQAPTVDEPAHYEIVVAGYLDERTAAWFEDLHRATERAGGGAPLTRLAGIVTDQAALHGILGRIRDLGLPLVSVQWIDNRPHAEHLSK